MSSMSWLVLAGMLAFYLLLMYFVLLRPLLRMRRWERRMEDRLDRSRAITHLLTTDAGAHLTPIERSALSA